MRVHEESWRQNPTHSVVLLGCGEAQSAVDMIYYLLFNRTYYFQNVQTLDGRCLPLSHLVIAMRVRSSKHERSQRSGGLLLTLLHDLLRPKICLGFRVQALGFCNKV